MKNFPCTRHRWRLSFAGSVLLPAVVLAQVAADVNSGSPNVSDPIEAVKIASFTLDVDPGWARTREWAFGHPTGGGGQVVPYPDPSNGATGSNVFGINLDGDYNPALGTPASYLTAGPFDLRLYKNVRLQFQRWLNNPFMSTSSSIAVSRDGINWTQIWWSARAGNPTSEAPSDNAWKPVQYSLGSLADKQPTLYIRWGHEVLFGGSAPRSGWNIDDIELWGEPAPEVPMVAVTVQTNPAGLAFNVDNTSYVSSQTFNWAASSVHNIATSSPQATAADRAYAWTSWSDGGAIHHNVAPSADTTYTANFQIIPPVEVTVQTSPAGRLFSVDGVSYTSAQTFTWPGGSAHTIAATPLEQRELGVRYIWANWSDNGAIAHVVAPTTNWTYTANLRTEYQLTVLAETGGTVRSSVWLAAKEAFTLSATAAAGYSFGSWSGVGAGSYTGPLINYSGTMSGPITQTAHFDLVGQPAYIRSAALGTLRNNHAGWVGMQIEVGAFPLVVSQLGRVVAPGNSGLHAVKLVRASDNSDIAGGAVTVETSAGVPGEFQYASLSSPVTLAPNTTYWVVSEETYGGDSWYDADTVVTTSDVAATNGYAWSAGPGEWGTTLVANRGPGPVNFRYSIPGTSFVTNTVLGTLSNSRDTSQGMQLKVGPLPIYVTELGRMTAPGNAQRHSIRISNPSFSTSLTLSIDMSRGTPGQFNYVALSNPLRLAPNSVYNLTSSEVQGGDRWYENDTAVTTTAVADGVLPVTAGLRGVFTTSPLPDHSFGPVNFKYVLPEPSPHVLTVSSDNPSIAEVAVSPADQAGLSNGTTTFRRTYAGNTMVTLTAALTAGKYHFQYWQRNNVIESYARSLTISMYEDHTVWAIYGDQAPFVTSAVPGPLRNDYTGYVGMQFTVGPVPLSVTHFGRMLAPGNKGTHGVTLFVAFGGAPLRTASVNTTGPGSPGEFQYTAVSQSTILNPYWTYFLASSETAGGDSWYDGNTMITTTGVGEANARVMGTGQNLPWTVTPVANQAYGPVNFKARPATTPYVTSAALGTLRNDYTGWVGTQLRVGINPLLVSELGRIVSPGSSSPHAVKLVQGDGSDVPGGAVTVATSGGKVGDFEYSDLASPVTLAAGATYTLLSQEIAGGDRWYDGDTTLTTTGAAAALGLAWGDGPGTWDTTPWPNHSGVPVNFKYAVLTSPFITSAAVVGVRNDYTGWVGMQVVVGPTPLRVTELGRMKAPGNTGTHAVKIVQALNGQDVSGSLVGIPMAPGTVGAFQYQPLSSPRTLEANTTYWVMSLETAGGDQWYDGDTTLTTTGVATVPGLAWGSGVGSWQIEASPNHSGGPVNFKY